MEVSYLLTYHRAIMRPSGEATVIAWEDVGNFPIDGIAICDIHGHDETSTLRVRTIYRPHREDGGGMLSNRQDEHLCTMAIHYLLSRM